VYNNDNHFKEYSHQLVNIPSDVNEMNMVLTALDFG